MDNVLHFYCQNVDEVKQLERSDMINYLNNPYAERTYFSPLSIIRSCCIGDEYVISNYMDKGCYCLHTPYACNFHLETQMHKHDFFEFMYVSSGQVHTRIESEDFLHHAGNLCLLNRNTNHVELDISDADVYYIGIEPQFLIDWPKSILLPFRRNGVLNRFFRGNLSEKAQYQKDYVNFAILHENNMTEIIEEMITAFSEKRIGYRFDIYSSLARFFAMLEDERFYKATYLDLDFDKDILVVEKTKRIIFEHHGCIQRQELAAMLNYSNEHLSRAFKKHMGITLKNYCQRIQMQEAAKLLHSTSLPISQIALSLGYENRTQFYKTFEKIYKMTPAEYRAKTINR